MDGKQTCVIGAAPCTRVRYGEEAEDWGAAKRPCSSCGVARGQLHVPGCFVERCPRCGGQAVSCECDYQESFARHPSSRARQCLYKLFYLVVAPAGVIVLVAWLLPFDIPPAAQAGCLVAIPLLTAVLFWRKLGRMELHQVIRRPKGRSPRDA